MHKNLLIIFVKNPQLGKVKTRLAATIGDEEALKVYQILLEHTRLVTSPIDVDKIVYYSDFIDNNDLWDNETYKKALQTPGDLGMRMQQAFTNAFEAGYESICIIGSDCYHLDETTLKHAFEMLKQKDVVIGPANDGGYYLLGMNHLHEAFFKNKKWSTESVLSDTLADINKEELSFRLLQELTDVDDENDLKKVVKKLQSN